MRLPTLLACVGAAVAVLGAAWVANAWRMDTTAPGSRVQIAGVTGQAPPVRVDVLERKREEDIRQGWYIVGFGACLMALALLPRRARPRPIYDADDVLVESILANKPQRKSEVRAIESDEEITEPAALPVGDREEQAALETIEAAGWTVHRDLGKWILSDGKGTLQNVYSRSDLIARARDMQSAGKRKG